MLADGREALVTARVEGEPGSLAALLQVVSSRRIRLRSLFGDRSTRECSWRTVESQVWPSPERQEDAGCARTDDEALACPPGAAPSQG
jgi:hypothetical protein